MTARRDKSADAFRTISEVANELGLATHVLRFWESKFPQIKPLKRAGGRRYYRPEDVVLLRRLQTLLHDEGYTIKGVQKLLREDGMRKFLGEPDVAEDQPETEDESSTVSQIETGSSQATPAPQGSLFDDPSPTPVETTIESAPEADPTIPILEDNTQAEEPKNPPAPLPATEDITYVPGLLPDAPEPEPVLEPEATPIVTQVIHQGLTDEQRTALHDVLNELKSMKEQIDTAA